MTTTELLKDIEARAKSLKDKHPAPSRPPWAAQMLAFWRECYKQVRHNQTLQSDYDKLKADYERVCEINNVYECCIETIMLTRPEFFQDNPEHKKQAGHLGQLIWAKLVTMMPEGLPRQSILNFYHAYTPTRDHPENAITPKQRTGTYNLYERNTRALRGK